MPESSAFIDTPIFISTCTCIPLNPDDHSASFTPREKLAVLGSKMWQNIYISKCTSGIIQIIVYDIAPHLFESEELEPLAEKVVGHNQVVSHSGGNIPQIQQHQPHTHFQKVNISGHVLFIPLPLPLVYLALHSTAGHN